MSGAVFPIWVYVAVALAIALSAFGLAQVAAGTGMPLVIGATALWTAFVASRAYRMK